MGLDNFLLLKIKYKIPILNIFCVAVGGVYLILKIS